MSSMGGDEAVTLLSGDNEVFSVPKQVACRASLIKEMLADTESDVAIPLPNVEGPTLSKVLEYCTWHAGAEADGASEDAQNDYRAKFVEVDQGTLCHLIMAAIYLNIAPLVDLACKAVADTMKGKTPEEIRAHFSIQSDLTPEEEAQVRRENAWCEEDGRAEAAEGSAAAWGAGGGAQPAAGGAFELLAANGDALAALAAAVDEADALCAALACRALRDALWARFPQHPPGHPQARTAAGGGAVLARPLVYFSVH